MPDLEKERKIFEQHVSEWRKDHLGAYVLIKDQNVVDFFVTLDKAFNHGSKLYGLETFFIEQILPDSQVHVSFFGRDAA